ncbi:MAG: hypothetical protein KAR05_08630 [Candidatus Omnitrophica bacterium]|nr:hypothetical protein [Candidatus Omnitrophota bacterium]
MERNVPGDSADVGHDQFGAVRSVQFREIMPHLSKPFIFGLIIWIALLVNFFIGCFGMGY